MPAIDDTSPRFIGKYEVLGELGHGGMAVVYRARDPKLDREVAVKVLHPHLAKDYETRVRFEREARAAAKLRHSNIVEVYEFSDVSERENYLVTELLEGPTLRRFGEQHPDIPAEVVAAVGVVLCDALACAHAQGVIHRDVKPDNLMLQRGQIKLTDFGIAHVADSREVTATGQVLGSPAHMAPEQIEGTAVDARTDLFAAGTVLYLLAVGKLPFEGPTAHVLLRKILEGDYPDPVRAAPRVGHRFANILRKCLARDPDERYESAAAMKADLLEFLTDVGWDVPERELRRYFEDPEGFTAAHRAKLLERLPALGSEARRRNSLPDAMGYFNRALALDPGNAKVLAMARATSRRRQIVRAARAVGIVAGAALVTAGLAVWWAGRHRPVQAARPMLVTESVPRRDPQPLIVPAVARVAAEAPAVDASALAVEDSGARTTHGTSSARVALRSRTHAVDGGAGAITAAERRSVVIVPTPRLVMYSVDGAPAVPWSSQRHLEGLEVGRRYTITVFSTDPEYERFEWNDVIPPGTEPLRVRANLRHLTHPSVDRDGTAVLHDAGPSRLN